MNTFPRVYPWRIPAHVRRLMATLRRHGYRAYVIGGRVRDLLLDRAAHDWDVATDAHPDTVMGLFRRAKPTGIAYGTVTVVDPGGRTVEVTTFRADGQYSDGRRPSSVSFSGSLEDDLSRRDFTVNAMALDRWGRLTDPFGGMGDLEAKVIRAVGDPEARFREDALRMLRAVRLAAELGFEVDVPTWRAIQRAAPTQVNVSAERVRDELSRCLLAPRPDRALEDLWRLGLLGGAIPELVRMVGFAQNAYHASNLWGHTIEAFLLVPPVLHLRLAALLHDVGKPSSLTVTDTGRHFYGHEDLSATMAETILRRLRYPNDLVAQVTNLVRHHMDLFNLHRPYAHDAKVQGDGCLAHGVPMDALNIHRHDAALRRLAAKVGPENLPDLVTIWRADAKATRQGAWDDASETLAGRALRVSYAPPAVEVSGLAVNGDDVMAILGIGPGPEVGRVLRVLLGEVMEDPALNERDKLLRRLGEFRVSLAEEATS